MSEKRKELHKELCGLLGSQNVYFQPPSNLTMKYPCIRYELGKPKSQRADNKAYCFRNRYDAIYISKTPDDGLPEKLVEHFLMCSIIDRYTSDNLHHTVLEIYY